MEESERRMAEAHFPGYEPLWPTKKLRQWGSEIERRVVMLDEVLD